MMQIMIPLAPGAQQIARVVRESVAAVIHHVLDGPADRRENALARGQARDVEAYGEADRIDDDGLCGVIVEAAECVVDVDLMMDGVDMLWTW